MRLELEHATVEVLPLPAHVAERAAELFVALAAESIRARGRFSAALSGGSTPRLFHEVLARRFARDVDWPFVHLFFSDERAVPAADERSNYRMAEETLLAHLPIPAGNVHRVEADDGDADRAARAYAATLERVLGAPGAVPDLVLLGMGEDGHTASLFPGTVEPPGESSVIATIAPAASPVAARVSFSYAALARAERLVAMVTGAGKAKRLAEVLGAATATPEASPLPLRRVVRARSAGTTFLVDEAAAAGLGDPHRSPPR